MTDGTKFDGQYLFYSQVDSSLVVQVEGKWNYHETPQFNHQDEPEKQWQTGGQKMVPITELAVLKIRNTGHSGRVIGTLVGAGMDVALIASAMNDWEFE